MAKLLKNGQILNAAGMLERADILIKAEKVVKIESNIAPDNHEIIDVSDKVVLPGFVDLHVHLREPGAEHKETIATGTLAAASGGFTTIAAMPNTNPVPDTKERLLALNERIKETAAVRVLPYGAITVGEAGKEITNMEQLAEVGAFAFTDDGIGVQDASIMLNAMMTAAKLIKQLLPIVKKRH